MTFDELSHFTFEELSNFTFGELSLDKYELMAKVENGSIVVPETVKNELLSLCTELNKRETVKKIMYPQNINTISDVLSSVLMIAKIAKILDDINITKKFNALIDHLIDLIH